ncbi:hypothetical protein BH18THE2_BH18THE2_27740 [soil metagenome]
MNSFPSTDRKRPGLLDSSSSVHVRNSSSVLAAGNSAKEHSTTFIGTKIAFPAGTSHILTADPLPLNTIKTDLMGVIKKQFAEMEDETGVEPSLDGRDPRLLKTGNNRG